MVTTKKAVVVGGYAQGPAHMEQGQVFRFVDVVEFRPTTTRTDLKNRMVLVYPGGQELSQNERKFWSEKKGDEEVSRYVEIHGTFEKADGQNPFAGVIVASKVVSPSRYSESTR